VEGFPLEHWEEERIREALSAIGNVCCIDPDCLAGGDYTSVRAVLRLDHINEVPEKLLIRNHSGPACIAKVHVLRTWHSDDPLADFDDYLFGQAPVQHVPPVYHPIDDPPVALPANVAGWAPVEVLVDNDEPTPTLRPTYNRRATPYPGRGGATSSQVVTASPTMLALPWYGIGGVPLAAGATGGGHEDSGQVDVVEEGDLQLSSPVEEVPEDVAAAMATLSVVAS
jgi:hypothetical protein